MLDLAKRRGADFQEKIDQFLDHSPRDPDREQSKFSQHGGIQHFVRTLWPAKETWYRISWC